MAAGAGGDSRRRIRIVLRVEKAATGGSKKYSAGWRRIAQEGAMGLENISDRAMSKTKNASSESFSWTEIVEDEPVALDNMVF